MKPNNQALNGAVFTVIYDPEEDAFRLNLPAATDSRDGKRRLGVDHDRPSKSSRYSLSISALTCN